MADNTTVPWTPGSDYHFAAFTCPDGGKGQVATLAVDGVPVSGDAPLPAIAEFT